MIFTNIHISLMESNFKRQIPQSSRPLSSINSYDQVTNNLENMIFFSEKIIVGPHEGEIPPPLAQMVLTQCISISELLVHHMAPPGGQI